MRETDRSKPRIATPATLMERTLDVLDDVIRYNECGHTDNGGPNDCCYCEAKRLQADIVARLIHQDARRELYRHRPIMEVAS